MNKKVKRPRAASLILLDSSNRILLLRRDDEVKLFPGCWSLIGGAIEFGETPFQAVKRECSEEIGMAVVKPKKIMTFETIYHSEHVFWAQQDVHLNDVVLNEGSDFGFFSFREISKLKFAFYAESIIQLFIKSDFLKG